MMSPQTQPNHKDTTTNMDELKTQRLSEFLIAR
jgi:hypothetical protein